MISGMMLLNGLAILFCGYILFASLTLALGHVQGAYPKVQSRIADAARETYAVSTLRKVDCDAKLERLRHLMEQEHRYRDPDLGLNSLAAELQLSHHQLSELINTRLGKRFSRYLREHRVAAAQELLRQHPSRSVLSIAMEVGFVSQSNFYQAFSEIVGMTLGNYRKMVRNDHGESNNCS